MTHPPRPEPPRLALRLLERVLDPAARDAIVGDLVERFQHDVSERGDGAARRHFWWEALVAVRYFGAMSALFSTNTQGVSVSSFFADMRYGLRTLRRAPAFALLCVITLALAIGPTTAIVSVVDPLLVRPLPYDHPDRLAFVWERDADGGPVTTGYATLLDLRASVTSLSSIAATSFWTTTLSDPTAPEKLEGASVTWNYFRTLGVRPAIGRDFTADEDQPGKTHVVLLTHALWERRFASDSSIVGRTIPLDGRPSTVIGVLPASFDDVVRVGSQIFKPLGYAVTQPWACRSCRHLMAVARIRDGISRERALDELNRISARLVRDHPTEYPAAGMYLDPIQRDVMKRARPALLAILGAVSLVLLIAIVNVVNLQLARAVRRDDEFAVRVALGAGAGRLTQQLIAEGLVLSLAGGVLGIALGRATLPMIVARLPHTLPRIDAIALDWRVLVIVMAIVAAIALIVGVLPARGARRRAIAAGSLRGAGRVSAAGHHRTRATLVVAEVSLALLLLVSAGLLAGSLTRLLAVDPGFDPSDLVTMQIEASGPSYPHDADVLRHRHRVLDAVRAIAGVTDVAISTEIPLAGKIDRYGITAEDRPIANPELAPYAQGYRVVGDYVRTMRLHLVAGRDLTDADERDTVNAVALISASLAKTLWGSEQVIGKRVHIPNARRQWSTVVGVVADVHHNSLDEDDGRAVYLPESGWGWASSDAVLVARTRGNAAAIARAIRAAVASIDPSQPITDIRAMDAVVSSSTAQRQLALTLFAAFALLALLLSAAGIYGILAGSVAERTREIGLRSALGATPANLLRMVLSRGMALTGLGIVIGLAGSVGATRYLGTLLYGIGATDPWVLGGAALTLLAIAALACVIPARRAIGIDPMVALRE